MISKKQTAAQDEVQQPSRGKNTSIHGLSITLMDFGLSDPSSANVRENALSQLYDISRI